MPPSALEKLQPTQMGQHQFLNAAGAAGVVATCVMSFQGDSHDFVPTWLLSCGLTYLEPLIILGQDRKLYFKYCSWKMPGTLVPRKCGETTLWPDLCEARDGCRLAVSAAGPALVNDGFADLSIYRMHGHHWGDLPWFVVLIQICQFTSRAVIV